MIGGNGNGGMGMEGMGNGNPKGVEVLIYPSKREWGSHSKQKFY